MCVLACIVTFLVDVDKKVVVDKYMMCLFIERAHRVRNEAFCETSKSRLWFGMFDHVWQASESLVYFPTQKMLVDFLASCKQNAAKLQKGLAYVTKIPRS